ncbi:hypothetical protein IMCC3317_07370 [Kordia antarctica]|uniref:Glutathionylspermidine synthase pre-ATP-grasp-like domain-containing protein n=1 Tax=Kordia antarctica TaxID=1218801 RepID=A0A7L4ZG25_9FLAO|nr:hypothetical protein [Kordia antarctica]QHI35391.1 hypothetical protein IMCC3317_07370 [Kordia antarctica]
MKNTILFDTYNAFIEKQEAAIPHIIDNDSEAIHWFFRGFKYPISSWPVIINKELTKDLEEISTFIPRVLQKVPSLYFNNEIDKIADFYFKGNKNTAKFSLMCHEKNVDVSCRLDLTYTEDGFKVLEVNMGSSIGGMEFQNFEPIIRELHPELTKSSNNNTYESKKTQSIYVNFLVNKVLEYVSGNPEEINIFLVSEAHQDANLKETIRGFYNELLINELNKRNLKGTVYLDSISKLKFTNKQLSYNDKSVQAVLILDFALNNITPDVFKALITNKIYFPDHLGTMFLRDKRNLALLRRLAIEKKFEASENEKILKCIPWTEIVADVELNYEGEIQNMITLLRARKNEFVIKISDGLQGNDVFVGKFLTAHEWEKAIIHSLETKTYIAQKFSDSIDLYAPNNDNQWIPHKLVWGAFGFGETYGGAWVRMSANKNDSGIINSATGAIEAIVYEYNT